MALRTLVALAMGACLCSCGGGGGGGSTSPPPPPPPVVTSVSISPASASLLVKATQQFTATVQGTGAFSSDVTWLVNDVQGGNATAGTITASGLYTAPSTVPSPNSVTVKAQSVQDSTKSATASVTVNPENVQITLSPSTASVQVGSTQQFTAIVTGTVNTVVTWRVNNTAGGNSRIGLIDQNGLYIAPANLPLNNSVTVSATSQEDPTKSASASVTITANAGGITVTISPQNPSVAFDGSQSIQFTATVAGTTNTAVSWFVDPDSNGVTARQITSGGLFTPTASQCGLGPLLSGIIRAVSAANQDAQAVTTANLVVPTPTIIGISPQPAAAGDVLQISGTIAAGANVTVFFPGPNGTSFSVSVPPLNPPANQAKVPLSSASGALYLQQTCGGSTSTSNSVAFQRLPRLRIRADRQVLSSGESIQMKAAFLGDPTPQPITWSTLFSGTVTPDGLFTAGNSGWEKVTGCITGTQQCDFFVFSIVPARIAPAIPAVPLGGTLQLSEVEGTTTLSPNWTIEAGGGSVSGSGLYTAPSDIPDSGGVAVTANPGGVTDFIGVTGAFLGMVNRLTDYPDDEANATG